MTAHRYITERELAATVRELAQARGWTVYQVLDTRTPAKRTSAGFPDLGMVRGERLVFAELKTQRGAATPEQVAWLKALSAVPGVETYLWRPEDLDEIERVLA